MWTGAIAATAVLLPQVGRAAPAPSACQTTAFVTSAGENEVVTIDVPSGVVDPNPIELPPGVLANRGRGHARTVYAANLDSADMTQVDVATLDAVTDLEVGGGPAGIAFTPCAEPVPTTTTTAAPTSTTGAARPTVAARPIATSPRFTG